MKTKKLVTAAMLLAIATVLSIIQIIKLPFGGSVTLVSMLPIILIAYIYGVKFGLLSALVYSLLQMLTGLDTITAFFLPGDSKMPVSAAVCVCLLDYVLAYTVLGIGGIFKHKLKNSVTEICLGAFAATFARYIMHVISGTIFFGAWAEWFFENPSGLSQISLFRGFCDWVANNFSGISLSLFYSAVYNGCYMLPEIIITTAATPIVYRILLKDKMIV